MILHPVLASIEYRASSEGLKSVCGALKTIFLTFAGILCLVHSGLAIEKWVDLQVFLSCHECKFFMKSLVFA